VPMDSPSTVTRECAGLADKPFGKEYSQTLRSRLPCGKNDRSSIATSRHGRPIFLVNAFGRRNPPPFAQSQLAARKTLAPFLVAPFSFVSDAGPIFICDASSLISSSLPSPQGSSGHRGNRTFGAESVLAISSQREPNSLYLQLKRIVSEKERRPRTLHGATCVWLINGE